MVYWSRIRVSVSTLTKFPRIKYIPSCIWKADPVAAAFVAKVTARESPAAMELFPSNPEVIVVLQLISSPSLNVSVELFVVLEFK